MNIIVDAMGGDNAPEAIVKGAVRAHQELGCKITLTGRREAIEPILRQEGCTGARVVDAREVISMNDEPTLAVRSKTDSSLVRALRLLKDGEGDAVVSAGSTGALLTGATLTVKRIRGIRRAALAPVLPTGRFGTVLIDCGANAECSPEYLLQFAYMGSFYSQKILGCTQPRVGLLNIGTEKEKGDALRHETYALLEKAGREGRICFVGNVEATGIYEGCCEVAVSDGFTGNVMLKTTEGVAKYLMKSLKGIFTKNLTTKLAAGILYRDLKDMAQRFNPNEVGGTPLLGISKPVIKAHGSANDTAIYNAVKQAASMAGSGLIELIKANIQQMRIEPQEGSSNA
jgi:glycerol-3-phosphate acyltransferase PlsX